MGEAQGAQSFLWELDGLYGCVWGTLKELNRFRGSLKGSMLLWGRLKELDRFCGSLTGSMVAVGDAQGARSFLWELDGLYGCSGGGSRSSIVSVGA